ncbi:TPM domain-containing protein [Aquabacter sp. CN5-332]|uniref:TPM domain-containing protein n=1 Tax=Aquabacter sp. CN5-332 TaxID=3156608 RepID=UPI0032B38A9F
MLLTLCLLFLTVLPALAELTFPALSGRVVDAARVLTPQVRSDLDQKLAAQEAKASDQFVVATVPSLQDTSVEDYANRLFRFWKLGQAKQNNGVLLLVAPTERKVRIEVGYGLEGIITDAVASTIINTAILPSFKAGDMAAGIVKGADAILEILNLDPEEARQRAKGLEAEADEDEWIYIVVFVVMLLIFIYLIYRGGGGGSGVRRKGGAVYFPGSGGGWSGGSSGGGGFSGGGGSSGGGGASGGW